MVFSPTVSQGRCLLDATGTFARSQYWLPLHNVAASVLERVNISVTNDVLIIFGGIREVCSRDRNPQALFHS